MDGCYFFGGTLYDEPYGILVQPEIAANRRAREAEQRLEEVLKQQDEIRLGRYMLYSGLVNAVRRIASFKDRVFPCRIVADVWDGIIDGEGGEDFLENMDRAQRCLTRLKEHPNAVKKLGIVLQKPKPGL